MGAGQAKQSPGGATTTPPGADEQHILQHAKSSHSSKHRDSHNQKGNSNNSNNNTTNSTTREPQPNHNPLRPPTEAAKTSSNSTEPSSSSKPSHHHSSKPQAPSPAPPATTSAAASTKDSNSHSIQSQSQSQQSASQSASSSLSSRTAPMDPMTMLRSLVGEKPTLKICMRLAVSMAKEQREAVGKFRKDERHACMELYETLGMEEDEMFGPPNELQRQLRQFMFPPPNMHLLRDVDELDDATADLILGPDEGQRRRNLDPEAHHVHHQGPSILAQGDANVRRAGVSSESTAKNGMSAAMAGAGAAFKNVPKNREQTMMLTQAMQQCVLFNGLDARDQKILFDAFELELFNPNEIVFEEGDDGDKFYMISEGNCVIELPTGQVHIGKGATFGELGVMYGTPRAATVTATTATALWFIDRDTYRSLLMRQMVSKRELHMRFLSSVHILEPMEEYEKARICDVLEVENVDANVEICCEGEGGDTMYFVEEGVVTVTTRAAGTLGKIEAGGFFGELALLLECPRKATCTAETKCRLLRLNRSDFSNALGPLESILRRNLSHYEKYINEAVATKR
eukprot:PhM_4_TR2785/c0_g1_i1/m.78397/K04739/PRKAR; cAMP-dependent protein kinase regulator